MNRERLPLVPCFLAAISLSVASMIIEVYQKVEEDYHKLCQAKTQEDLEAARKLGLDIFDLAAEATEAACRGNKTGSNCSGFSMDESFRTRAKESLGTLQIFCSQKYGKGLDASTIQRAEFNDEGNLIHAAKVVMHRSAFAPESNPYHSIKCEVVDTLVHETAHTVIAPANEPDDHDQHTDWIYMLGKEAGRLCNEDDADSPVKQKK